MISHILDFLSLLLKITVKVTLEEEDQGWNEKLSFRVEGFEC